MPLTAAHRGVLRRIWAERPTINAYQLREKAAREEDLLLPARDVQQFLEEQKGSRDARAGEKLGPKIVYKGKIAAEGQNERWQADLGFMNFTKKKRGPIPEKASTTNVPCFLLVVDVFTRFARSEALPGKAAAVVLDAFRRICQQELDEKEFENLTLTTDRGGEFGGVFRQWVVQKGIVWRVRAPGAKNDIAVCDQAMAEIKREIARLCVVNKTRAWQQFLDAATRAYNSSAKKSIHGAPETLAESGSAAAKTQRFLVLQDNAAKLAHNDRLNAAREFDLADRTTTKDGRTGNRFMPPIVKQSAFEDRVTIKNWGGARLAASFPAPGVVRDTRGQDHALKLVRAVGPSRSIVSGVRPAARRAMALERSHTLPAGFEVERMVR